MYRRLLLSSVVVVAAASGLSAQEPSASTIQPLPEVVVTASRLPAEQVPLAKYPANVTVISRTDIAASPATTLPDLLRQQVGLTTLDTVGFGQFGNISMRGYGERSGALILVDGVRVNDAGDSTLPYLWNTIPLDDIERIEVIRGGSSTTYGEGAIAGVINIITKKPADKLLNVVAGGAGGNLGYYNGHAELSGRTNWFDYVVTGDRLEWDGWRDGSAYRGWTALAKPGFDTPVGRFTFSYNYHDETTENPDALTKAQFAQNPRQKGSHGPFVFQNQINRGSLDYAKTWDSGWTVLGKAYGQTFDTRSHSGFGVGQIEQPNYGGTLQASWRDQFAGHENELTLGAEAIQQDFRSKFSSAFGKSITDADNWTASAFAQDNFAVTERLHLLAGVRFDYRHWDVLALSEGFSTNRAPKEANVWSPKFGATYEIVEKVSSWITFSRSFRLPSGFDIGAAGNAPGALFFANPNISPVDARTAEVGVRSDRYQYLGGSVTYYYSEVRDDILFDPFTFENRNFDSVRQGVELALNSHPAEWVDFYFNASFADAHFDGGKFDGNRLPLVPEWQFSGGTHVRPMKGLTLTLEAVHVLGQVANNDLNNDFSRNEYTVVNARADYRWRFLTAFVKVNNLFDSRYELFPTVTSGSPQARGFNPAPGINFQIGGKLTF